MTIAGQARSMRPFLMFEGQAQAALNFYRDVFPNAKLGLSLPHADGKGLMLAEIEIAATKLLVSDSSVHHPFSFTPSVSLFVEFDDAEALDRAFAMLSAEGEVRMPLGDYGFSPRFGWTDDRFGVSWQLNLRPAA